MPVNADVPVIDVIMVPEQDERVNDLGIKGIGEKAAVASAMYNATGCESVSCPLGRKSFCSE